MIRFAAIARRALLMAGVAGLGVLVGAVAVFLLLSGPASPLQLWHTVSLDEEFTAERAAEVRTFEDYRQLEDRLFAELDEKVYAETGTGPEYALVRYSRGSAADPGRHDPRWNRSFELPADAPRGGVLLLHGMSDSPYTFRTMGQELNRRGYWVLGLRMPGHGTVPAGLKTLTLEDMTAAVRLGVAHLASRIGPDPRTGQPAVHIMGYSTGAPLALDYALDAFAGLAAPKPASLVLVSPAIGLSPAAALAGPLTRLARLPGLESLAWTQVQPEYDPYKYNSFTANAGAQVHRLTRSVAGRIATGARTGPIAGFPPTLVFLSTVDATVSAAAVVDHLLEHLAPEGHELVLFDLNRQSVSSTVMIADPGPLTARLMAGPSLPFALTLVANESAQSARVISLRKPARSQEPAAEPLDLAWPTGVLSLSHVALPFPPDDPLYGQGPPANADVVFLGQIAVQGERGLLLVPSDQLLRLRHNPFFAYLARRAVEWMENSGHHDPGAVQH
jgi:alpha-beta hydrolase superfamily lysophospholipase